MLATTSGQVGFFDAAELARPLPAGSFFALLAEHGHRIARDEDFAACYAQRMGRPSIPPSQLAKVLLLQYRTGASDEQAMECVTWDLRWKIALGLAVDHQGWHPTSLTKFRARLLLHELERVALERTLAVAEELGMLDGPVEQIIDSTPMLGAAATQDTVRLVRHGVRKLLDAVAAVDKQAAGQLDRGLEFDYAKPSEKPDCRWREKAERERMLTSVAQDAERALQAVESADGLLDDEAVTAAHELLRELIGQDFDIDDGGIPRLHRGTRPARVISTVDSEMRHGRKSSQQRFDGYKLSAAATNTAVPLITAVDVAPASETDGPQAKHLIDSQPEHQRPQRVLGDTAYGNGPVRAELAERDVDVLAPVPEGKVVEDRLAKRDFEIDFNAGTVTCPAGHTVQISTSKKGFRGANFTRHMCRDCPLAKGNVDLPRFRGVRLLLSSWLCATEGCAQIFRARPRVCRRARGRRGRRRRGRPRTRRGSASPALSAAGSGYRSPRCTRRQPSAARPALPIRPSGRRAAASPW
jgi:hypothetical protein